MKKYLIILIIPLLFIFKINGQIDSDSIYIVSKYNKLTQLIPHRFPEIPKEKNHIAGCVEGSSKTVFYSPLPRLLTIELLLKFNKEFEREFRLERFEWKDGIDISKITVVDSTMIKRKWTQITIIEPTFNDFLIWLEEEHNN